MTQGEYQAQRDSLVKQLSGRQSVTQADRSVTNRSIKEIQAAISALDAEWHRQQGTSTARIGRMYISGEGR